MGLGRRTFAPGEVLTASNVMNYLMDQSVMNFAGSAARGSAIGTAIAEGMVSYLNDTDSLEVYRAIGTAAPGWNPVAFQANVPTNAQNGLRSIIPTGVTVSTGSGSFDSTSGLVTFTNARDINLAGIFTTSFRNYHVVLQTVTSASTNIISWFTTSGTNIAAGYYGSTLVSIYTGSTVQVNRNNAANAYLFNAPTANLISNTNLNFTVNASSSQALFNYLAYSSSLGASFYGGYNTGGAPDGFRVSAETAGVNLTGTMKVYGYN